MQTLLMDSEEPFCPPQDGELIVESGLVWLTEQGNATDLFLRTGHRYHVVGSRRPIVQAMSAETRLSFKPAGLLAQIKDACAAFGEAVGATHKYRPHPGN